MQKGEQHVAMSDRSRLGENRRSLLKIYRVLMRSVLDYGCVAYISAAETNLKKLDVEQAQAL